MNIYKALAQHLKAEPLANVLEAAVRLHVEFGNERIYDSLLTNDLAWRDALAAANELRPEGAREIHPPSEEMKRLVIEMLRARMTAQTEVVHA